MEFQVFWPSDVATLKFLIERRVVINTKIFKFIFSLTIIRIVVFHPRQSRKNNQSYIFKLVVGLSYYYITWNVVNALSSVVFGYWSDH